MKSMHVSSVKGRVRNLKIRPRLRSKDQRMRDGVRLRATLPKEWEHEGNRNEHKTWGSGHANRKGESLRVVSDCTPGQGQARGNMLHTRQSRGRGGTGTDSERQRPQGWGDGNYVWKWGSRKIGSPRMESKWSKVKGLRSKVGETKQSSSKRSGARGFLGGYMETKVVPIPRMNSEVIVIFINMTSWVFILSSRPTPLRCNQLSFVLVYPFITLPCPCLNTSIQGTPQWHPPLST